DEVDRRVRAQEVLEPRAEVDADVEHDPGPDRRRNGDGGREYAVWNPKHAAGDGDRDPETRDVAAEDDRQHAVTLEPVLGPLETVVGEVDVLRGVARREAP